MIVKMRKMDLLLYHREQEKFLDELRNLGVVHIVSEAPVDSLAAQELRSDAQRVQRIAAALKKVQSEKKVASSTAGAEDISGLLARFDECDTRRERIEQDFASLQKDKAVLAPWGDFDPQAVKRLAGAGIDMKFYTMPTKKFAALDKSKYLIEVVSSSGGIVYFAAISRGEPAVVPGAEEARLPEMSLKDINARAAALEVRRTEVNSDMETMAGHIAGVVQHSTSLQNQLRLEQARTSMQSEAEGKLLGLSGWVPQQNEANIAKFLEGYAAYVTFRDPAKDEAVPIKLKNNPFNKLFEPILALYALPNYRELNFAPFVAPFFILFFGLCFGDTGYGFLLTVGALIAMFKVGPKLKPFMKLGVVFGVATMACGVLLNGFFGGSLFGGEGVASLNGEMVIGEIDGRGTFAEFTVPVDGQGAIVGSGVEKFSMLAPLKVGSDTVFPAMGLSMLIGFVQMFFGMFIQSYIRTRERGIMAGVEQLGLIALAAGGVILGVKTNFLNLGMNTFAVGKYNIGELLDVVPLGAANGMVIGGIIVALFFGNIDSKFFVRPLKGIWSLYGFSTSFLSYILSYLRLFALGLAGGLLGAAINQIAFMFITNDKGDVNYMSFGIIATVLIMVGGHALNFALAMLGAFVHPLRLTFVEFYNAVGFEGGGKPYAPFAKVEN